MSPTLHQLNALRLPAYRKSDADEAFLQEMNRQLAPLDAALYRDIEPEHPFVFVFGVQRS